ncbi:uncharacterized protein LOC117329091 [Pecten maximus]|uniref:uncharacterized protein LOC117329091 n=1 Tax=Pecten maximus TaxID=6579 RepID=UPI0014581F80|nr:uncharacterized protein LOC117329091 [Pecten maximus]
MLPTWTPIVCELSLLLWMACTGISSLRIDTYVFDDWSNETFHTRMLMEKEIASWTLDIPVSLHFTTRNLTVDYMLFEDEQTDDLGNWKIVLDVTTSIDLVNCGIAMANNIPYISSSSESSSDCYPITFRPSPSNILNPVIDVLRQVGTTSDVILLLLDSDFDMDPGIVDSNNKIGGNTMIYNIQGLIEEQISRRLLIDARRVIISATYSQISHFFHEMVQTVRMLNNEWILLPLDSDTCPGQLNVSFICIHQQGTSHNVPHWMDALHFMKGAFKTMEEGNDTKNHTSLEYFQWYTSSHHLPISISKHTSSDHSTLVGDITAGRTTLYRRPDDVFEPPPPPVLKVVVIHVGLLSEIGKVI